MPNDVLPSSLVGTVWINHDDANNSGITIPTSTPIPLFDLIFQPRHTSHVSLNSDVDIRVSELRPIFHVPTTATTHLQQSIWAQVETNLWSLVSSVITPGKVLPHSSWYFQGPLVSTQSAPIPLHASGTMPASASVRAFGGTLTTTGGQTIKWSGPGANIPGATVHLPGPVTGLSILIQPSSFYVGDPVGGIHEGFGVDHVPEPATLILLVLGALAAAMQRWTRRRMRQA